MACFFFLKEGKFMWLLHNLKSTRGRVTVLLSKQETLAFFLRTEWDKRACRVRAALLVSKDFVQKMLPAVRCI